MFGLVSEFKSSLIFWALPLLPSVIASYTGLALVCASTAIYAVYHQTPSEKLRRLLDGITTTWEILNSTKTDSGSYAVRVRGIPSLLELEDRLLQAQLSASLIRVRLLELREKPWAGYLRSLPRVITDMDQCARDVKKIHVETLPRKKDNKISGAG
ncbi:hypothetical protein FB45DRAFT_1040206 [Roridomyces roridus]|uniref:Uncharacterized protein n=1 Tax=Roridomyces roridus TaxID=1738132 RepID=A0AAD7F7T3_9AGAR|nr:hypothetical protein FB45DRAFT_1040206 [Roridomyces roridus]